MQIQYNLLNLPTGITYSNDPNNPVVKKADYTYSASGAKLMTTYTNGATTTNNAYCGNMIYENNALNQILVDGGYITFSGTTPVYHCYLKDHLGNNRVVARADGTVEQVNHYYPFGAPFCERTTAGANTNATLQRYKYNGKELDLMHGLKWYDYGARMYDPILLTWNGIDPMCEDYYPVSPYAYCGNNPINRIDPDGMKFLLSNLTDKQLKLYNKAIGYLCNNSQLFSTLYKMLDESDNTFIITLGNPVSSSNNSPIDGQFISNDSGGGKIILSESRMMENNINETVYAEEYFHAFQYENVNSYAKGSFNYEFEAKVYATAVGLETSGFGEYGGMEDFQNSIRKGNYGNSLQPISPQVVNSTRFEKEYRIRANAYAKYNIKNNIGNHKYRMPTTVSPYSLRKIINSTY